MKPKEAAILQRIRTLDAMLAKREEEVKSQRGDDASRAVLDAKLAVWRTDALGYITGRLGVSPQTIDWEMNPGYRNHKWDGTPNPFKHVLRALEQGRDAAIESAVGTGKTFFAACVALWFLECFPNSLVITTAPGEKQLSLHMWKELELMTPRLQRGRLGKLRFQMTPGSDVWLLVGMVAGTSANEESATRGQGAHREHMLIIYEETPGIPAARMAALQNTCTAPHNIQLALGNPDHKLDALHTFCTMPSVDNVRISAYDHPNVVLDNASFIPGAQSRAGLKKLIERYRDPENVMFKSRAKGICPDQSIDSLIRLEWLYACEDVEAQPGPKALGVDVANSIDGDAGAIARGEGNALIGVEEFPCPNSNDLGIRVAREAKDEGIDCGAIGIDGVGVGAGCVNAARGENVNVRNLMGGNPPEIVSDDGVEEFLNLRAQMYWAFREDVRNRLIRLTRDEQLYAELTAPKYMISGRKIVLQSKDDIKKQLRGKSPNKADAAVYWNWVRRKRSIQAYEFESQELTHVEMTHEAEAPWR